MTVIPRAILVDYGGVLTERMSLTQNRFCLDAGIEVDSLVRVLDEWVTRCGPRSPVPAMERGELGVAEFERLLAKRLQTANGTPVRSEGLLRSMFAGSRLDERMLRLVASLRERGVRTAMVSNAWGSDYPFERLRDCFDEIVLSNEIGFRKPDPQIYRYSCEALGVTPADCVFVDDRTTNLDGARRVGMTGFHYTDPQDDPEKLRRMFSAGDHTGRSSGSDTRAATRTGEGGETHVGSEG